MLPDDRSRIGGRLRGEQRYADDLLEDLGADQPSPSARPLDGDRSNSVEYRVGGVLAASPGLPREQAGMSVQRVSEPSQRS
jgi:hypothetical protein